MRKRMGDYELNQTPEPAFPLASAMAASAAFPILIGPLVLGTKDFTWSRFTGESRHATLPTESEVPRNTAQYILEQAGLGGEEVAAAVGICLSEKDAELALGHKTTLRQPSEEEFNRLYRHGWEVAVAPSQPTVPNCSVGWVFNLQRIPSEVDVT